MRSAHVFRTSDSSRSTKSEFKWQISSYGNFLSRLQGKVEGRAVALRDPSEKSPQVTNLTSVLCIWSIGGSDTDHQNGGPNGPVKPGPFGHFQDRQTPLAPTSQTFEMRVSAPLLQPCIRERDLAIGLWFEHDTNKHLTNAHTSGVRNSQCAQAKTLLH